MSHDTDPKPLPDPKEKAPNAPAGEPHPPEQPELDGLDPSPTHAGDGPDDELTFELPPPGASPSSFTM
ncbi:MAG TPA: hypothetical protein VKE74_35835, partial [Gemmataceae bacterium]|nr:hypothetical protein [Gemmataceae bacterium]